jgi:uncharacterized protein (DUF486 family)
MAMSQIIAAGGGANQGAAILISWAAALLASALAVIANRIKRKPLLIFAILVEAVALVVSGAIAHVFGWWPGNIVSAAIMLLPIALEVWGCVRIVLARTMPNQSLQPTADR